MILGGLRVIASSTKKGCIVKHVMGSAIVFVDKAVRNRFFAFAEAAALRPELEKPDLLQPCPEQPNANRRRPADIFASSWRNGLPAVFDFAITSPIRQNYVVQASCALGAACEAYEQHKRLYLNTANDCTRQGLAFG